MTIRRTGLILAGIAVPILLVSTFAARLLLDTDRYRTMAVSYLQRSTGKTVEIGRLSMTIFPKLVVRVEDIGVRSPPLFPRGYILKAARIDVEMDPWALLHRRLAVESIVLQQPVINLVSDPDGPWNFENPGAKNRSNAIAIGVIASVKIKRGHVLVSNLLPADTAGPVFLEAHDIFSELSNVDVDAIVDPASTTVDGHGTIRASLLRFGSIEAHDLHAAVGLQARQVSFTDVTAETYGGRTRGTLSMKFSGGHATFSTNAKLQQIDVPLLLNAFANARGKMTGKMDGELRIAGAITHSQHPLEGLHGNGHLSVRDGQLPGLRLNANLMKLARYNDLGPAQNDPSSFKLISTDLELDHERISSKVIDIDGYGVDVDGSGTARISAATELDYQGVAQIVSRQGFMTNLFGRLAGGTVKDGKLSFPFHIGGTIDNPVFSRGQ